MRIYSPGANIKIGKVRKRDFSRVASAAAARLWRWKTIAIYVTKSLHFCCLINFYTFKDNWRKKKLQKNPI